MQARGLDLQLGLVAGLTEVIVTQDLAVARLLLQRMIVMKDGRIVEEGLADRLADDPRHPHTRRTGAMTPPIHWN